MAVERKRHSSVVTVAPKPASEVDISESPLYEAILMSKELSEKAKELHKAMAGFSQEFFALGQIIKLAIQEHKRRGKNGTRR